MFAYDILNISNNFEKYVLLGDFWRDVQRPVVYFLFRKHYILTVPQCDLPSPLALTSTTKKKKKTSGAPVFINNG